MAKRSGRLSNALPRGHRARSGQGGSAPRGSVRGRHRRLAGQLDLLHSNEHYAFLKEAVGYAHTTGARIIPSWSGIASSTVRRSRTFSRCRAIGGRSARSTRPLRRTRGPSSRKLVGPCRPRGRPGPSRGRILARAYGGSTGPQLTGVPSSASGPQRPCPKGTLLVVI